MQAPAAAMSGQNVPLFLFMLLSSGATLLLAPPSWSWDTVQTYIHCANTTGEWNQAALKRLAAQRFVVFEKNHKL